MAPISRKAKKKLEKVVLRKQSKTERKNLLAELKKCQLQPDQLNLLHSTSSMQTKGLKRFMCDDSINVCLPKEEDAALLIRRKRRRLRKPAQAAASSSEDTDAVSTDDDDDSKPAPTEPEIEKSEPSSPIKVQDQNISKTNSVPVVINTKATKSKESKPPVSVESLNIKETTSVPVFRDPKIEEARLKLPIIGKELDIMDTIKYNDIIIVTGKTGSGKTTQIPQFLYEYGYTFGGSKMIGITEPRRVAAVSMSERVGRELNLSSEIVSYQIRFSGNVTSKTQVKFMTDGVLMRECQQDFLLTKYSVIIIDEAHERSIFSDILIGLLSRIVPMRAKRGDPLKLIIMSATLKLCDFTKNSSLFKDIPPTIKVDTSPHKLICKFAKETPSNYLQAAYRKVCSVHAKAPPGGILVFVTSQMDVNVLCKKLRQKYPKFESNGKGKSNLDITTDHDWSDVASEDEDEGIMTTSESPLHCIGLYAMLPLEKQRLVFKEPPAGSRLCVVATNVAETSITIPNIKYVVDTGMEKTKVYDMVTGVSRFVTTWTSKSSAKQRRGRAGRMGKGYCFRLYSSAVYNNNFPEHPEPRILQKPVEDLVLQMKSMNIDKVVNFPFPTSPSKEALKAAEKKLIELGALDDSKFKEAKFVDINKTIYASRLTDLGKAMSCFAVGARCAKMIALSPPSLLPHVIALVSALTVREMFLEGNKWREIRKKWRGHGDSKLLGDYMLMLRAISKASLFGCSNRQCIENGLSTKAMLEIDKLRKHLTKEINSNLTKSAIKYVPTIKKPTEKQANILRKLLLCAYFDHVAKKIPNGDITPDPNDPNKKIRLRNAYECSQVSGHLYIDSESALKGSHPDYIIFKEVYQGDKKKYMRDIAVINPDWSEVEVRKLLMKDCLMNHLVYQQDPSTAKLV